MQYKAFKQNGVINFYSVVDADFSNICYKQILFPVGCFTTYEEYYFDKIQLIKKVVCYNDENNVLYMRVETNENRAICYDKELNIIKINAEGQWIYL